MRCDSCLNARRIVSENGFHPICCLPDKEVRECLITGEHYVRHPWYREEPEYKEDCYWYSEWQDMNAHIPTCKAGKNMDSLGLCLENCKDCDSYHSRYEPTNADKVRAMTDGELADWYWWMLKHVQGYTDSRLALTEWLKKEAEE